MGELTVRSGLMRRQTEGRDRYPYILVASSALSRSSLFFYYYRSVTEPVEHQHTELPTCRCSGRESGTFQVSLDVM